MNGKFFSLVFQHQKMYIILVADANYIFLSFLCTVGDCTVNVNECNATEVAMLTVTGADCPPNSQCRDSVGSFTCRCDNGYVKNANNTACDSKYIGVFMQVFEFKLITFPYGSFTSNINLKPTYFRLASNWLQIGKMQLGYTGIAWFHSHQF